MLGIPDPGIWLAMLLCLLATLLCVVYGAINWHHDGEPPAPDPQDIAWAKEEKKIETEL